MKLETFWQFVVVRSNPEISGCPGLLIKSSKQCALHKHFSSWFLEENIGAQRFIMQKLFDILDYDVWRMFDILKCDKIYQSKFVCSARFHGIRGLGTEIVLRSEALALDLGCTHSYVLATGEEEIKFYSF